MRLWCDCYASYLASEADGGHDAASRAVRGLATELFVSGRTVRAGHHDDAVAETAQLMADPSVATIFEAAFAHGGVRVRVDVLERAATGSWDLLVVASGLELEDVHADELALHWWVLRGTGVEVGGAGVVLLDRSYRRRDALEPARLFVRHDCTAEVRRRLERVAGEVEAHSAVLSAPSPPAVRPGPHCWDPSPCPYRKHCLDEAGGGHPLSELPDLSASQSAELAARGICDIAGLPATEPLTEVQARARDSIHSGQELAGEQLGVLLAGLRPPVHHLTVGIVRPAAPRFDGMGPYQRVPYAFCDLSDEGVRRAHLGTAGRDPREELADALVDATEGGGSVCTYGWVAGRVIEELGAHLPGRARALGDVAGRLVDLRELVAAHYYHPDLHGSFALERVAAVLGVPPWHQQSRLQDEYAAGMVYETSLAAGADQRAESEARLRRYFGRCSSGLAAVRRALAERAGRNESV